MANTTEPQSSPRKLLTPERSQVALQILDLETTLPDDHVARLVWEFVERLDLSAWYRDIQSLRGGSGRPATDPRLLMALWLYATLDGVGSAREVARLCELHAAYRWLCGGVPVNYHTLSDFRSNSGRKLDELLETTLTSLLDAGIVTLNRVTQDGTRVRANAGASSFRRGRTLKDLRRIARQQVGRLREELEGDAAAPTRRQKAARERAQRESTERIERALKRLGVITKESRDDAGTDTDTDTDTDAADDDIHLDEEQQKQRVSTTDDAATVMKMADGGYRPAFNIQIVGDAEHQIIIGYDVTTQGTDMGLLKPALDQLEQVTGIRPASALVDGGYVKKSDIEEAEEKGTKIYAPPPTPKNDRDPATPARGDSDALAQWRTRMATEEGKAIYKRRSIAECYNAHMKNRGLRQVLVRGIEKVRSVVALHVLTHNFTRLSAVGYF